MTEPASTPPEPRAPATPATRSRARRVRGALTVALVLALAGLMFTANARLARGVESRHPENIAQLVDQESGRVERLSGTVDGLNDEIEKLSAPSDPVPAVDADQAERVAVSAGSLPVSGPGLSVSLDDAPPDGTYPPQITADDLVVHQQDVQAVVNALWAGGAEAMTLQGQRVTSTSAFRCAGNILLLHGRVYSPPYVVEALGDPDAMRAALDRSERIQIYKQYVDAVNLGWGVHDEDTIDMPRYEGALELKYARPAAEDGS